MLGCRFRNLFLRYLTDAFEEGKLGFHGEMAALAKPTAFATLCCKAKKIKWVVHAKPPFGGPEQVLKYLARYTHRVAISNRRLLSMEEGRVSFEYKDYAEGDKKKVMNLEAVEFIRRFLLHILPAAFVRIRQFGFLANRARRKKLALCRALLAAVAPTQTSATVQQPVDRRCPVCNIGRMVLTGVVAPAPRQDSS